MSETVVDNIALHTRDLGARFIAVLAADARGCSWCKSLPGEPFEYLCAARVFIERCRGDGVPTKSLSLAQRKLVVFAYVAGGPGVEGAKTIRAFKDTANAITAKALVARGLFARAGASENGRVLFFSLTSKGAEEAARHDLLVKDTMTRTGKTP